MRMAPQHNGVLLDRCVYPLFLRDGVCAEDYVNNSINSLSIPDLVAMAHHPTSSRVLDTIFESPTVPYRTRNKFVLRFMGHFHELVDDRIGSRVGDRMWAGSDPYLKVGGELLLGLGAEQLTTPPLQEKIAKSLSPHEQNLAGSQYGKYFVRNMNLMLLKRDPDAWRAQQSSKGATSAPSTSGQIGSVSVSAPNGPSEQPQVEVTPKPSSKRKRKGGDDIDRVFDSALGKKQKRSALPPARKERTVPTNSDAAGLESILGAIKDAPKGEKDRKHKKKKVK